MKHERFRWLAAVIAAHPDGKVVGRTRLQKEMRLLQRLKLPSDYDFRMHYYGPYSEGIQSDINLLDRMNFVSVEEKATTEGRSYSVFVAGNDAHLNEVNPFKPAIERMAAEEDAVVLELAATYDSFRYETQDHGRAFDLLKRMKADKCQKDMVEKALKLLSDLELWPNVHEQLAAC